MKTDYDIPDRNGMPGLGLGTWQNDDPEACSESVRVALETGYRHIDTAQAYGNEAAVGRGIAAADVDRDAVFLATKLWIDNLSYDAVFESAAESLDRLGTEYLDLLYVHWPAGDYDPEGTLGALEELYEDGVVDRIGVSNFEPSHVERAQEVLDAPIFANQIEVHPLLQQRRLREFCAEQGIEVVAYSPLARGNIFENETLASIAADYDASEAQVTLAWLRQHGLTPIPKATGGDHIRDNWASLGLELSDAATDRIDAIEERNRFVDPSFGPDAW